MLGEFVFVFVSARFSCKPRVLMVHFSVQCYFIHFLFFYLFILGRKSPFDYLHTKTSLQVAVIKSAKVSFPLS